MRVYSCPSLRCAVDLRGDHGGDLVPVLQQPRPVIPEQFSGILKPDYILPFKLSKGDAVSALQSSITREAAAAQAVPR